MRTAANVDSQTSKAVSAGVNPLAGITNQHEIAGVFGSHDGKEAYLLGLEILHFVDDHGVEWTWTGQIELPRPPCGKSASRERAFLSASSS